ncbi:unnamed protein product, partial [Allacma fusca]
ALLFLAKCTRPDISFCVSRLSQFLSGYDDSHWKAAKGVLRYLKGTLDFGLKYQSGGVPTMETFTDSDHAGSSQIADGLTKPLIKGKLEVNRSQLGIEKLTPKTKPSTAPSPWFFICLLYFFVIAASGNAGTPVAPVIWRKSDTPVTVGHHQVHLMVNFINPCQAISNETVHNDLTNSARAKCDEVYQTMFLDEIQRMCPKKSWTSVSVRQKRFIPLIIGVIVVIVIASAGLSIAAVTIAVTNKDKLDQVEERMQLQANMLNDAIEEHDLLQAIRVPFEDPKKQYFESGSDGFPAYGLKEGADIKSHYRWFLPERLYRDFAILATVKLEKRETAYLFAVVNPLDTLIQFGIKISPSVTSSQHVISLLYTDVASHLVTQTLVSFEVPTLTRKWTKFAIKVVGDDITLYLNCQKHSTEKAYRNPKELVFDTASTLYIGQAGPLLKGYFQVSCHNSGR